MFQLARTIMNCGGSPGITGLARSVLLAAVLAWLAGPTVLHAQKEKLPKAEQILDKYVEVTGGKAAYNKLKNRIQKMTLEPVGSGIKINLTTYGARPNKTFVLMESDAFGKVERGTNEQVVWESSMMMGTVIKTGQERDIMLRAAVFDQVVQWRKLFKKVECVGVESIDDKPCYKIVMTPNEGPPETRYYYKDTHLLAKLELRLELPMGNVPVDLFISDYKEFDGVLYAHHCRRVAAGQEILIVNDSIEHNVEMAANRFDLPEAVQALLKKDKAANEKK